LSNNFKARKTYLNLLASIVNSQNSFGLLFCTICQILLN
jgi:hypothetical protein